MRRTTILRICLAIMTVMLCWPVEGAERKRKIFARRKADTLVVAVSNPEIPSIRKMISSAFPVQISVSGRAVQILSEHNQLLPIYNGNGVLYLTARLNKGTNWLGGLPRGHYFINNRPITIN